jgi:uncharacterized caspase-like protein
MNALKFKNAAADFVRCFIVAVTLLAWSGALAQTTAEAYVRSGISWSLKSDFDRAIADYNQALRINPQYAAAYLGRGVAWEMKGNLDRAIADFNQALRINPQYAEAYFNRGIAWVSKRDYDRAIADYTQALRINPQLTQAKENLIAVQRLAASSQAQQTPREKEELANQARLVAEAEAKRKKQQELGERLAAELKERERLRAETEAERKRRQELEEQLAKRDRAPPPVPVAATVLRNPHALVIGNAAYPGSGRLDNPLNDAAAVAQKLRTMGFSVTVVTDANRQRLVQALSSFRKSASASDLSLLFYSGHGAQIFGTNYILPIDADQSDVAQATIHGVSLNSVVENFLPGKTKIVFLDACRDNPLQRSGERSVTKGLAPISVAQGTLIAYATKDGQTASDGVGQKNSPFTTALLQHLADPEDIGIILRKVREKVMAATAGTQQPWEYGSLTGGALVLSAIKR